MMNRQMYKWTNQWMKGQMTKTIYPLTCFVCWGIIINSEKVDPLIKWVLLKRLYRFHFSLPSLGGQLLKERLTDFFSRIDPILKGIHCVGKQQEFIQFITLWKEKLCRRWCLACLHIVTKQSLSVNFYTGKVIPCNSCRRDKNGTETWNIPICLEE